MTNLRGNGELGQNIQPDKASNALLMLNMPSTLQRTRTWPAMVTAPTTTAKYTYVRGLRSTVTGTGTRNRGVAMMIAVVAVGLDGGGERGGK